MSDDNYGAAGDVAEINESEEMLPEKIDFSDGDSPDDLVPEDEEEGEGVYLSAMKDMYPNGESEYSF